MPNHKTPHWTDGDGIGKKLTGPVLTRRLAKLAETASTHHQQADQMHRVAWQGWLEHSRQAGEALLEAQRRLGHRSKWSKWRKANFKASKETACDYARVAREWENPIGDRADPGSDRGVVPLTTPQSTAR